MCVDEVGGGGGGGYVGAVGEVCARVWVKFFIKIFLL